MIKTRNLVQIRSHAQKYFQKLLQAKNSGLIGEGDYQLLMDGKRMATGFVGAPAKVRMCAKVASLVHRPGKTDWPGIGRA